MSLADKLVGMDFTPPGGKSESYSAEADKDSPSEESDEAMSREELGSALSDAIDSGDGAAIFEAIRKIIDTPDAE